MKDTIKFLTVAAAGIVGAAIPILLAYQLWAWLIAQVPSVEIAWAVKIAITLAIVLCGGGVTIALAFTAGSVAVCVVAFVLNLVR